MAIVYKTNTLPNPSTTLAKDLMDGLISGMTQAIADGKTTWSIVDSGYVNGTTERVVFNNTAGFSLMLLRSTTLTNTQLSVFIGTDYNTTTHTLNNIGFGDSTARLAAASGFSGQSYNPTALPGTTAGQTAPTPHTASILFTATASQTNWSVHVEDDYAMFTFKDGTANLGRTIWAGKFISLVSNATLTDTYPFALVSFSITPLNNNLFSVMLHSLNNGSKTTSHNANIFTFAMDSTPALPASYDKYSLNPAKAKLSYIYIARASAEPPTNSNTEGWLRGYLPGIYHGYADNAAWGDTVSIDGKAYMLSSGGTDLRGGFNTAIAVWCEI